MASEPPRFEQLVLKQANALCVAAAATRSERQGVSLSPRPGASCFFLSSAIPTALPGPLAIAMPWGTGASRLRLLPRRSATQLRERAEEHALPGTPAQEPIEQTPTRTHDLARQRHQRV